MEQKSEEWYRARLGHITGSMVYCIMGTPRKKDEVFSETAKAYLYQLAAERNIAPIFKEEHFAEWLKRTNVETFAMRYGSETESLAREVYYINVPDDMDVKECGFFKHPTIDMYGDSPDGIVYDVATRIPIGCIEIKCPNPNTWMKYRDLFLQGKTLKDVEEKYYWQCQSHMMCTETTWCDFIYFDKMMKDPLCVECIERNDEDVALMEERIMLANEFIENMLSQ